MYVSRTCNLCVIMYKFNFPLNWECTIVFIFLLAKMSSKAPVTIYIFRENVAEIYRADIGPMRSATRDIHRATLPRRMAPRRPLIRRQSEKKHARKSRAPRGQRIIDGEGREKLAGNWHIAMIERTRDGATTTAALALSCERAIERDFVKRRAREGKQLEDDVGTFARRLTDDPMAS